MPATDAVAIRLADPGDVSGIARIWQQGWADAHLGHVPEALIAARTPESFRERARTRLGDTIVATRAGRVAGFAMTRDDEVDQVYVSDAARGTGLGGRLLDAAERAVIDAGHERAWLAVATGNTAARRFYERRGWIDAGSYVHAAPVPGGSVGVDCHRFLSPPRTPGSPGSAPSG